MEWELPKTSWYVSDGLGPICAGFRLYILCSFVVSLMHSIKIDDNQPEPKTTNALN